MGWAPVPRHHTATAYVVARGRTLLLWHARLGMWLPPGGHCDPNETPVEAAIREAMEESGLDVAILPPDNLFSFDGHGPEVLPPPECILVEDIVRDDQEFHQHIDHVYFTEALSPVDYDAPIPHGIHRWLSADELLEPFSLPGADGTLVAVAEDVRLLGVRAIAAASERGGSPVA